MCQKSSKRAEGWLCLAGIFCNLRGKRKYMDLGSKVRIHRKTTEMLFDTVERKFVWPKDNWT